MISLTASIAILGVLAVIAVTSLGGTPTATVGGSGANPLDLSVAASVGGGAAPAVPGGLIDHAGDTVAQQNLSSALSVVDQVALTAGGYGA